MENQTSNEWKKLVRMNEQDRVSQASSLVTISSFPVRGKGGDGKVQNFGKRERAVKRDPNCPVVIRGWLYKQDSSGLKLWKRRWFVLSDYCLFYYKDSREESVLGSIPLPSYSVLFCTPRECKNRKYAFKAVHHGMRSYYFSADTQEDMLGWVRALSQSACMESDSYLNRRCSSFQDFTQVGGSSESLVLTHNGPTLGNGPQNESGQIVEGKRRSPQMEPRGKHKNLRQSSTPRTSTPTSSSGIRRRGQSLNQEGTELDSYHLNSSYQTPPLAKKSIGSRPLTPRSQFGSRPHTPVGRVDIRPQDDLLLTAHTSGSTPPSPKPDYSSISVTPTIEKRHTFNKSTSNFTSLHHIPMTGRSAGKTCSHGGQAGLLPPLPPPRIAPASHPSHHHHHRSHMSVCPLQQAMPASSDLYQERDQQPHMSPESDVDAMLTRMCGCDKLLQSLSTELAQLQADKSNVQCALEMTRLQLDDFTTQRLRGQSVTGHEAMSQQALLQEELVTVRARMCDVSMEMEKVWSQYERMESELSVLRSHLQHICRFGRPEEQSQAQRELWMMEDILCGLKANRNHFRVILGSPRQPVPSPVLQKSALHSGAPGLQPDKSKSGISMGLESEPPPRPPLPPDLQVSKGREVEKGWLGDESEMKVLYHDPSTQHQLDLSGNSVSFLPAEKQQTDIKSASLPGFTATSWSTPDTTTKKVKKMSEVEQMERIRRNQERLANQKRVFEHGSTNHTHCQRSSPPREEPPFPLRVTRVITGILPSTLTARHVSVEDPPPELITPFLEQISPGVNLPGPNQTKRPQKEKRERSLEKPDQNSNWLKTDVTKDGLDERSPWALASEMSKQKYNLLCTAKEVDTSGKDDGSQLLNRKRLNSPAYESTEAPEEKCKLIEMPKLKPELNSEKGLKVQSVWPMPGREYLPSDISPQELEVDPTLTGGALRHRKRDKVRDQAPLLASDLDHDPGLTSNQREAKLKRVERIRERVICSAVRKSNVQQLPCQVGANKERLVNLYFTLANEASQMSKETAEVDEECQHPEGLNSGSCCHDNMDSVLHHSKIPSLNDNKSGGNIKSDKFDNKKIKLKTLDDHSIKTDIISCSCKGVFHKQSNSNNHIPKMTVFSRNLESVQKAEDSHPYVAHYTKEEDGNSVNQNESHLVSTNRRAEWFLSTNHKVEFIPSINQSTVKDFNKNAMNQDRHNARTDLTLQISNMTKNTCFSSTINQNLQRLLEDNASTESSNASVRIKVTSTEPTTYHLPLPEDLPYQNKTQPCPQLAKFADTIKTSDESIAKVIEGKSSPVLHDETEEYTKDKITEPQKPANNERRQNKPQANQIKGCSLTDDSNLSEWLPEKITPPYTKICFISPIDSVESLNGENNSHLIFAPELQVSQSTSRDTELTISPTSTKSTRELHIYEEIGIHSTNDASKTEFDKSKDIQLSQKCDNSLPPSPPLYDCTQILPTNSSGHSPPSVQSVETGMETSDAMTDWAILNTSPNEANIGSEAAKGCADVLEKERKGVKLRNNLTGHGSLLKGGKNHEDSPSVKARVTVVRTSL